MAGCRDVHSSLRELVREETLRGDNRYNTRDPVLGRQEAKRSTRFKVSSHSMRSEQCRKPTNNDFGAPLTRVACSSRSTWSVRLTHAISRTPFDSPRLKALPKVLQLHLKRFEYDVGSGSMTKLQHEFSFPTRLKVSIHPSARFLPRAA